MAFHTQKLSVTATLLFFIQIFSTLSFSVLYSTLVLYATDSLGFTDHYANSLIASFVAFNFGLHLLGGYAGGRFLSFRNLFIIGMLFQIAGCLIIAENTANSLLWGLTAFLVGSGLNVTCINCLLTQLFTPEDKRREKAFLWNYSGMNIGFFIGFMVAGYFQLTHEYSTLFILSAIGNVLALLLTIGGFRQLKDVNTYLSSASYKSRATLIGVLMIVVLFFLLRWLLENATLSTELVMWVGLIMAVVVMAIALREKDAAVSKKIWAYCILGIAALCFWTLYQMIPMGLTLFIERNVTGKLFGGMIPPQWFSNINSIIIIIGGPLLAQLFQQLRKQGFNINIPFQFSIALLFIGVAMLVLTIGIHFADPAGYTHYGWVVLSYILLTLGELCISPIGYAMIGELAPARKSSLFMGTWMLIVGVGATLSDYFSGLALGSTTSINPLVTNTSFSATFSLLGWISIIVGIILLCITPLMQYRLIQTNKRLDV